MFNLKSACCPFNLEALGLSVLCDDLLTDLTPSIFVSRVSHTIRVQEWLPHFNYPTSRFPARTPPYLNRFLAFNMQ